MSGAPQTVEDHQTELMGITKQDSATLKKIKLQGCILLRGSVPSGMQKMGQVK